MLKYASKFMELSRFAPAFVANERLKMNQFEVGLNPAMKERMSVHLLRRPIRYHCQHRGAMKERSNYFNE